MTVMGYILFALALVCYVATVKAIWILVSESNGVEPQRDFNRFWWMPAWKVHRRAFPKMRLHWFRCASAWSCGPIVLLEQRTSLKNGIRGKLALQGRSIDELAENATFRKVELLRLDLRVPEA